MQIQEMEFPQPLYNEIYEYNFKTNIWKKVDVTGEIPSPRKCFIHCYYKNSKLFLKLENFLILFLYIFLKLDFMFLQAGIIKYATSNK